MSEARADTANKRRPRYLVLADSLAKDIISGRYPVGSLLPTEQELCERHRVSRYTVRSAIQQIQLSGLVSTRQGLGTRVERTTEARQFALSLDSIDEAVQHGHDTRLVDVVTRDIIADDALAKLLPCERGQQFLFTESYRVPRDASVRLPVAWNESYVIAEYAEIRDEIGKQEGSVFALIERRFGERIDEIRQEISAINLSESIALRLHVETHSSALRIKRSYVGRRGVPVLYGINTYPGDRFTYATLLNHRREPTNGR